MTETIETRDAKMKNWFIENFWQNKTNLILLSIILATMIIRIFFFMQSTAAGQTLWWDEAEYMSQGLHYATGIPYLENPGRPPAFQYMIALCISFGLNENWIIFLLSLLPSVLVVVLVFILGSSMFNKRVGLIAATLLVVSWDFIFWSNRAQPDFLSLCCQVLAIFYFWEMLKKKSADPSASVTSDAIWAGVWSAAGFYFKVSALLIPAAFLIFILLKDKLKIFTKKEYWIYGISYIIAFLPYIVWSYVIFGQPLGFVQGYSPDMVDPNAGFAWNAILYFKFLGLNVMSLLFIAGLVVCLKALLYLDIIIKKNDLDIRLFIILIFLISLAFYIFYIRAIDDRWVFIWLPIMAILCGMVLDKIYQWTEQYGNWKWLSVIMIIGLLAWASYEQFNYAQDTINVKVGSYKDVKDAAIWMAQNSQPNDIIMSVSYTQTVFYSKRHVETFSTMDQKALEDYVDKNHPIYIAVSIFEPHQPWVYNWVQNNSRLFPVMGYFIDSAKTQPSLIIYKFNYS